MDSYHDEHGRLLAGSVHGWGMSWWYHEQGILSKVPEMTVAERMQWVTRFWAAVADGWQPTVPDDEWHGDIDPFEPSDGGRIWQGERGE